MRRTARLIALLIIATAAMVGCTSGPSAASPSPSVTASIDPTDGRTRGPAVPSMPPASTSPASTSPAGSGASAGTNGGSPAMPFTITSSAFADGASIPAGSTCHGADRSPELSWSGVPEGATALALVVDDPDANDWVHWLVLDLPPDAGGLPAAVPPTDAEPRQGTNTFGRVGYSGPCPPSGTHHYRFTLYALSGPLGLSGHPDGDTVRRALAQADVLATATLHGTAHA